MRVYYHGRSKNHKLIVQPAIDEKECIDWREVDGRPKMFEIQFKDGMADIPANLAQYLIDKQLASISPIITTI